MLLTFLCVYFNIDDSIIEEVGNPCKMVQGTLDEHL